MRKQIEKFCEEIKEDYILFLYNKEKPNYPYCCKLSADIITSYLNMVLGNNFKYICTTSPKYYNHAWTYYNDEEEFIIDFTEIQFSSDFYRKNKREDINIDELKKLIKKQQIVFDVEESHYIAFCEMLWPKEQKCYGIIKDFKGELNKFDFMAYLELVYDQVFEKTIYQ